MKSFCNLTKYLSTFLCCFSLLISIATPAICEETYVFERIWPTLQQPWYSTVIQGMAVDDNGNLYVADYYNHRLIKYTSDGIFITSWGTPIGEAPGPPSGIAIDSSGAVYVVGLLDRTILKFTSTGDFLDSWEVEEGSLTDIAISRGGDIYVAVFELNKILKFSSGRGQVSG